MKVIYSHTPKDEGVKPKQGVTPNPHHTMARFAYYQWVEPNISGGHDSHPHRTLQGV